MKPRQRVISGKDFDEQQVITQVDGSYRNQVFVCIAADQSYIIGKSAHGGMRYEKEMLTMFARDDVSFKPVGPDVMKALNLQFQEEEL